MLKRLALASLLLWPLSASAQVNQVAPIPAGAQVVPLTFDATGTTGQIAATFTKAAGKFTYICGFLITSGQTTVQTTVDATITGLVGGTKTFAYVFPSSGQGVLGVAFPGCITSSAKNTSIIVNVPASGGAGTAGSVSAWGYTN